LEARIQKRTGNAFRVEYSPHAASGELLPTNLGTLGAAAADSWERLDQDAADEADWRG
jgi:hypothetical protein